MPIYNRFEELPVWKLARKLTILVYRITSHSEFAKDYGLIDEVIVSKKAKKKKGA